jgi:hypothetical protein
MFSLDAGSWVDQSVRGHEGNALYVWAGNQLAFLPEGETVGDCTVGRYHIV